jgi:hypothetical protein
MTHAFTPTILGLLSERYGDLGELVFEASPLLKYINTKTKSASRGSKSRSSFANHYALYVLVEDYLAQGYLNKPPGSYARYEGAQYSDLFQRQRALPFGGKLQNHALNGRLNEEFAKYFHTLGERPIVRDPKTTRYWINERLLLVMVTTPNGAQTVNIAPAILQIIDAYVAAKRDAFERFIQTCQTMATLELAHHAEARAFVVAQLAPAVDARVFEIVSYAILKAHYGERSIFWGFTAEDVHEEALALYKTGRTNANDGGIDFVMRPLGRFFQVTETIHSEKYFLDIDKVQRYPVTFVVKTNEPPDVLLETLRAQAMRRYGVDAVVNAYLACVEEIINIPALLSRFDELCVAGRLQAVMDEVLTQSRMEFNWTPEDEEAPDLGGVDDEEIEA